MRPQRAFSRAVLASAVLGFLACQPAPAPQADAEQDVSNVRDELLLASAKVALPPEGLLPAELPDPDSPGAQTLATYCGTCHALPSPLAHSATDWPSVARRMWLRMGRLDSPFSVPIPTSADRVTLSQYLVKNALKVSAAELPEGPGRDLFATTCTQCHELPDPRQHSPEDWVSVVRRMMTHMQDMLGQSLSQDQLGQVSGYLSAQSK